MMENNDYGMLISAEDGDVVYHLEGLNKIDAHGITIRASDGLDVVGRVHGMEWQDLTGLILPAEDGELVGVSKMINVPWIQCHRWFRKRLVLNDWVNVHNDLEADTFDFEEGTSSPQAYLGLSQPAFTTIVRGYGKFDLTGMNYGMIRVAIATATNFAPFFPQAAITYSIVAPTGPSDISSWTLLPQSGYRNTVYGFTWEFFEIPLQTSFFPKGITYFGMIMGNDLLNAGYPAVVPPNPSTNFTQVYIANMYRIGS